MDRRSFLQWPGTAPLAVLAGCPPGQKRAEMKLAGRDLKQWRAEFEQELFGSLLPFWERHGVDHQYGGVFHGLDYDGTLVHTQKLLWFQGRAIWVYSFLYNHLRRDERYLEVARRTRDFVLRHARQPDGWWAEVLDRDGTVLRPFQGDLYGMYFLAEGLQEYAWATKNEESLELALGLLRQLRQRVEDPGLIFPGAPLPGARPQGLWMVNLRCATQILRRWSNPEIEALAQQAVEAVINRHWNPEIRLNNEWLAHDFTRIPPEASKCLFGHSIETLWMVLDEADRRADGALWRLAAERIERHIEAGWDRIFGGVCQWVNVDHPSYVWPVENPVGTDLEFRYAGEYHYMKPLWALHEVLIACLMVFERTQADWASRWFGRAHAVIQSKFSRKAYGQPGYMLFADRRMSPQAHVTRQDNYHPLRQLMLNLLSLERLGTHSSFEQQASPPPRRG